MLWGRLRAGYGEIEELEFGGVVLEGAEDEGDAQRGVGRGWKRGRGAGHTLYVRVDMSDGVKRDETRRDETYEFEFGFAAWRDADGLDALLAGHVVVEAEEGLMWAHAGLGVLLDDLEGEFEGVGWGESERRRGLFEE